MLESVLDVLQSRDLQTPISISGSTYWFAVKGAVDRIDGPGSVSASSSTSSSKGSRLVEDPRESSGFTGECRGPVEVGGSSLPRGRPVDVLFSDETEDQLGLDGKGGIGKCSLLLERVSDKDGEAGMRSGGVTRPLGTLVVEVAKDGEDEIVDRFKEGAGRGFRIRLETTLA